jgi:hypothetical protein
MIASLPDAERQALAALLKKLLAGLEGDDPMGYLIEDDFVAGTVLHAEGGRLLV